MKLSLQKSLRKNNSLCLTKRRRMMMKQSSQVEKKDVMLGIVKDTEILDAEEISDSMDLEVTKEDKKMKGIVEGCCEEEDIPNYDLSIIKHKHKSGETSSASCDVCMAVFSISDFSHAPSCNHRFCKECIEIYLLKKIQKDVPHVVCPESKCNSVLEPEFCRKFIPEELFDRWKSELNLASSFRRSRIICPNSDCEEQFMDDGKGYKIRACPKCWNLICMPCGRVEWHMEEDCETFRRRTRFFPYGRFGRRWAAFGKQHDFHLERRYGRRFMDNDSSDFLDMDHYPW